MNKLSRFTLLFIALFYFLSLSKIEAKQDMKFRNFSLDQGLSQVSCLNTIQDRKGFIWIGTYDGLNRFDGYKFTVFRNNYGDSLSLSNNFILCLLEDSKGNLWVGTREGLNLFDAHTQSFKHFKNDESDPNSISNNAVYSLLEDSNGDLWVGTRGGLNKYETKTSKFTHFRHDEKDETSISSDYVISLLEDRNGNFWVGTRRGGLNLFNPKIASFQHFYHDKNDPSSISNNAIRDLYEDKKGNLWIGTDRGLNLFEPNALSFVRFKNDPKKSNSLKNDLVRNLFEDSKGNFWISTYGGGLNLFDPIRKTFKHFVNDLNDPTSLSNSFVLNVMEDNQGDLWVGTYDGLNLFNPQTKSFIHFKKHADKKSSLSYNNVTSILELEDQNLWIGTQKGLNFYNAKTKTFKHFYNNPKDKSSLSNNHVWSLLKDSKGRIWAGTYRGLSLYNANTQSFESFKHEENNLNSLSHSLITCLLEDSKKNLWVGTQKGLNLFDYETKKFTHFIQSKNQNKSKGENFVRCLFEDSKGQLWVGTDGGLNHFDPLTKTFNLFTHDEKNELSISNNIIGVIYEDSKNNIWIGTWGGGLNKYNPEKKSFKSYHLKDGLSNEVIYGILEDNAHNLWISTNKGVNKFNYENETFTWYDKQDGLQSNEFNSGAFHKGQSGKLYFGGVNGLSVFEPDDIKDNTYLPSVVLTDFLISNYSTKIVKSKNGLSKKGMVTTFKEGEKNIYSIPNHIEYLDEIILDYTYDIYGFEFSALNYRQSEKNQFAYKLEGFNEDWIYTSYKNRIATYTDLPDGHYTFKVKATNDDGYWQEAGASIKVTILPPPWLTWWALTIYLIVFIAAMYGFVRWRSIRLLKEKLKLEKTVRSRTTELRESHYELKQRNEEIFAQTERFKELDKLKSRFFSNISHEFRTPLTLIIGPAKRLLEKEPDSPNKKQYNSIISNAERLLRLITQLLDFSKIESGKMTFQPKVGKINTFLKEILYSFDLLAEQQNISLEFVENQKDIDFSFDHNNLEKVIYNLLSNAFKFTPKFGKITLILNKKDNIIEIIIRDSGIGIPMNQLPHIFDRFYQVDNSQTREFEGTGIGLSLSKELIELHKGVINVYSEPGKGTEFFILLPIDKTKTKDHEPETIFLKEIKNLEHSKQNKHKRKAAISQQGIKDFIDNGFKEKAKETDETYVLVVEDNAELRDYICEELKPYYKTLEAADGMEGIQNAFEVIPDLIISDLMMPKVDGYELTKALKRDTRTSHIPIIMLTAKASFDSKMEGLEMGADDYLTKPFNPKELLVRVKNKLELARKMREKFGMEITKAGISIEPTEVTTTSMDANFLKQACDIVEENIDDDKFGVEKFCEEIGMSRTNLHRKLKAITNQSTTQFIRSIRLKRAAQLLKQKSGRVEEIARDVGFSSMSYFHTCFKEQFGMTASQYAEKQGSLN